MTKKKKMLSVGFEKKKFYDFRASSSDCYEFLAIAYSQPGVEWVEREGAS